MFKSLFDYCNSIISWKYRYIVIILGLYLLYFYVHYMQVKIVNKNIIMIFYLVDFLVLFLFTLFMHLLINEIRQNMLPFFDLIFVSKNQKNLYNKIYFFSIKVFIILNIIFWLYITVFFVKTFYINTPTPKNFTLYVELFTLTYYFFFFLFYILVVFQFFFLNVKAYKYIRFFKKTLWYLCCLIFILIWSLCTLFQ